MVSPATLAEAEAASEPRAATPELAATPAPPAPAPELAGLARLTALAERAVLTKSARTSEPAPAAEKTAAEPKPAVTDPAEAGRIRTEPVLTASAPVQESHQEPTAIASSAPTRPASGIGYLPRWSQARARRLILAPLQDASGAIVGWFVPAGSAPKILRSEVAPRITLPGPALPPALNSLQDAGIAKILVDRPKPAKSGSHGWVTGLLVAVLMIATFFALELYNAPRSAASVRSTPSETEPATPAAAVPAASSATTTSFPLSKAIEVTGFRFVGDKKPEVHFLVVNHSSTEMTPVTLYVTLRGSTSKLPLYHFSFRAPSLSAFESKEVVASVDKTHPASDWQGLHADIEIGQ